jgi:hypothetical protein
MNAKPATGLGEPEPMGKKALFRPPERKKKSEEKKPPKPKKQAPTKPKPTPKRKEEKKKYVRTTIKMTAEAYAILQTIQQRHRLKTGEALPLWKAVSQMVETYGKTQLEEG